MRKGGGVSEEIPQVAAAGIHNRELRGFRTCYCEYSRAMRQTGANGQRHSGKTLIYKADTTLMEFTASSFIKAKILESLKRTFKTRLIGKDGCLFLKAKLILCL